MDVSVSSARLPIRQIRNANLAWIREDLGQLDELIASIRRDGLQLPVLLTPTLQVADGARRIAAYEAMGRKEIPVLVTGDWSTVQAYFDRAKELRREGLPYLRMSWKAISTLYAGPLKELYTEELSKLRKQIIAENKAQRAKGVREIHDRRDLYLKAAASVLGFLYKDLRSICEVYAKLGRLAGPARKGEDQRTVDQRHAWAKSLLEQLEESERNGGDRLYAVKARVDMAWRGEDPGSIKEAAGRRQLSDPPLNERKRRLQEAAPSGREVDGKMLANVTALLTQLSDTAPFYTHVRPSVKVTDAREAAAAMRSAVGKINGLIRVIKAYASDPNLEERP